MSIVLDFEQPLEELRRRVAQAEKHLAEHPTPAAEAELRRLYAELEERTREVYGSLTAWQTVQVARHPQRPHTLDIVAASPPTLWSSTATGASPTTRP